MNRKFQLTFLMATLFFRCSVSGQVPSPTVSPDAPEDVEIPVGFAGDPVAFFDDFSWRSFVALNWPAAEGKRGLPDRNKDLGQSSKDIVWGTWKADHEIFQPGGLKPSPWDAFEGISPDKFTSFADAGRIKVLGGFGRQASDLQIEHFNQAGPVGNKQGSLVSRNRRYVTYEIRINRPEFEFIRDNDFYLAANLPTTGQLTFPIGSGEIKAAWRMFTDSELQDAELLKRYFTSKAIVVDPDGSRKATTVGLVGLHIVRRTTSRREWIWSSFEHIDNLSGAKSTLLPSTDPSGQNVLRPAVDSGNPPQDDPDPVPVKRLQPVRGSTALTNEAYHSHAKIKGTVWENYQLVLTQWPRTPAQNEQEFIQNFSQDYPSGAGNPSPTDAAGVSIANVTMETTGAFQQSFSCMRCHFNAGKFHHTEFVWTLPLRAWRADPDESTRAVRALRNRLQTFMESTQPE
ncbi:MAG: hypothetical protein ABJZ55_01170 [Fuerstiella sp.]